MSPEFFQFLQDKSGISFKQNYQKYLHIRSKSINHAIFLTIVLLINSLKQLSQHFFFPNSLEKVQNLLQTELTIRNICI